MRRVRGLLPPVVSGAAAARGAAGGVGVRTMSGLFFAGALEAGGAEGGGAQGGLRRGGAEPGGAGHHAAEERGGQQLVQPVRLPGAVRRGDALACVLWV